MPRTLNWLWSALCLALVAGDVLPAEGKDQQTWVKARALRPGDTIAMVAPAGPITKEAAGRIAEHLRAAGFQVQVPANIDRKENYLAGSDDERANELNAAIRDPKVAAIFPVRGGFGLTRILDRLNYETLRKNPKIVTGFSDLTGLHLAIARKSRLITFHSPMSFRNGEREDDNSAFNQASYRRAVFADKYKKDVLGFAIDLPPNLPGPVKVVGGKAQGRLVGGNLSMISATMGTPFALEPEGKILLIEDVNEAPYRIDRMLSQLRLAGALDAVAGVVLGQFTRTGAREDAERDAKEIERLIGDYFGKRKIPVVRNFPFGHGSLNATLPLGAMVELDADAPALRVVENPVALE